MDCVAKDSTISNATTPVGLRTCKSCLRRDKIVENGESELDNLTEQYQCDKCRNDSTISQSLPCKIKNIEKCPMCDLMFESAELLDDHLLSPESCRQDAVKLLEDDEITAKDEEQMNDSTQPDTDVVGSSTDLDAEMIVENETKSSVENDVADVEEMSNESAQVDEKLPAVVDGTSDHDKQATKDENSEEIHKEDHEGLTLTLDGSVVDEMEDKDKELQQLAEELQEIESNQEQQESLDMEVDEGEQHEPCKVDDNSTCTDKEGDDVEKEAKDTETDIVEVEASSCKEKESVDDKLQDAKENEEAASSVENGSDVVGDQEMVEDDDKVIVEQTVVETKDGESAAEKSPVIMCSEIVEEPDVTDDSEENHVQEEEREEIPVPVAAIPATSTMVLTTDCASKDNKTDDGSSKTDTDLEKPKVTPTDEDSRKPTDNKKHDMIDSDKGIVDKDRSTVENKDPAKKDDPKVDKEEKEPVKSDLKAEADKGHEDDNKSGDDGSQSSVTVKRRFATGNETLDQDVVEILQDATNSGGRVTRSMRNKKQQVSNETEVAKKLEEKSPSKAQSITCKLVTSPNSAGSTASNKQGAVKNNNGSITLQVPVSSVQSGAKFIITIPENNNSQTPPGKYLITVPPTKPGSGETPQVKSVLLKASPISSNSCTTKPIINANTVASTNVTGTPVSSAPTTSADDSKKLGMSNKLLEIQSETAQKMQLKKTVHVAKLTHKVYVKELEEIDRVIFECPKCKFGFPHMLLAQLHMEDCCHHPPTQKPSLHLRIPTEILLKFFDKVPHPTRQNYKCVCCPEILTFRRYRVGKYYPLLATHFAKHTTPAVKVVNYTEHSQTKELADALTVHSKQAIEWVDHMVPPFTMGNQPVSHSFGTLDSYLCTSNKLHQESLLLLEYDSDELEEEMYLERKQKEKKKKKRGRYANKNESSAYVCNWKSAIVKEETNVVEVTEVGTPKSAFPEFHRSGSLKHSILHSPSKALAEEKKKSANQKAGKKKKGKTKKDVSKQLFVDENRRRSPRKGGVEVFLSLPQNGQRLRRGRLLGDKVPSKGSDDDIILLSSEEDSQHGFPSKESENKNVEKSGRQTLSHQGSVDDDSSRSSFLEGTNKSQDSLELRKSGAGKDDDDRPPSRGSSIICLSDSNEEESEDGLKKKDGKVVNSANKTQPSKTSTKSLMQKAVQNNAAQAINNVAKLKPSGVQNNADMQKGEKKKEEEVKKRKVPEAEIDEEIMVLSDVEDEEEEDGVDWNSDNYDPILLDKHQVKTYFQMSREEPGIYECSLGGCSSCDCVAESDLFEHLRQHVHVEKVHPQKRSKTILFKGKVVPQYLKLTRHQIWAHFSNVTVNAEMEICDEYMQQYKQCRWGNCGQRVWTKYGRLSHHLRSHLRFTQIDNKRYHKMREVQKISEPDSSHNFQAVLQKIPVRPTPSVRPKIVDGEEVVCLPEDVILSRYKYGKSPSKNVRGIFSCLSCSFSHHLDANASAVTTVKILAHHLKQHLPPYLATYSCLITPKAMKASLLPDHYATKVRLHLPSSCRDLDSFKDLPGDMVSSCYDTLRMKVVEPVVLDGVAPILNKDGVLYRCLYSGCHIGVVGDRKRALLKHIKGHKPDIGDKDTGTKGKK